MAEALALGIELAALGVEALALDVDLAAVAVEALALAVEELARLFLAAEILQPLLGAAFLLAALLVAAQAGIVPLPRLGGGSRGKAGEDEDEERAHGPLATTRWRARYARQARRLFT